MTTKRVETECSRKVLCVRAKNVSKDFPLDNVHMMKANSTSLVKVDSVTYIKPDGKPHKTVVKSLEEWAAKILCRKIMTMYKT